MSTFYSFLLVSDSPGVYGHQVLPEALAPLGCLQVVPESEVASILQRQAYDAVIVDAGAVTSAPEVVRQVRAADPHTEIVVATASPHWKIARAVLHAGAADYVDKFLSAEEILGTFRAILERGLVRRSQERDA